MSGPGPVEDHTVDLGDGWLQVDSGYISRGHTAVYLVSDFGRWAVLDTAHSASTPRIIDALENAGADPLDVDVVFVSHAHLDHCGGAGTLMAELPKAKLYAHEKTLPHLVDPAQLIAGSRNVYQERFDRLYGTIAPVDEARVVAVHDGDVICVGGHRLEVLETPGHTFNHVCALDRKAGTLFAGDTFGVSWPPQPGISNGLRAPAAPTQFAPEEWKGSIRRIVDTKADRVALSHFGLVSADLPAHADELCREIDKFASIGRESLSAADQKGHVAKEVRAAWRARFGDDLDRVEAEVLDNDINLCRLGISHWATTHLSKDG